ncbi:hypothetical protein PJ900_21465 [Tistrella mobilis]|uniref:Rad50/SbcC-type AAA domain-containing protein n=1 Tax=Tistrella mobilis TaxID=171437 RepID=A0A162K4X7_9PROT|nr:hypothetical protein [Tistrella mobilis]KYO50487.1 hypothetical protein AUP44_12780 [Tistrella mobilis]
MSDTYLQLRRVAFIGPQKTAELGFSAGLNVICGASDTGKSFLAEAIDYMLGGSTLREIPELVPYAEIVLDLATTSGETWRLQRSTSGGNFKLTRLGEAQTPSAVLKQNHAHDSTDNVSGFLLNKIGLVGRRILKSGAKGTTQSLSFRNLARLVVIQEGEIQEQESPFWGGQYTLKTAELATIKLLLTGVDDSAVVAASTSQEQDSSQQLALIDELIADLQTEIADVGTDESELNEQMSRLAETIEGEREALENAQSALREQLSARKTILDEKEKIAARIDEIREFLARFSLLQEHYVVDLRRLSAIQESGSLFVHLEQAACPLCGASPSEQHLDADCEGDIEIVVRAATVEIEKIERLQRELTQTVADLQAEGQRLSVTFQRQQAEFALVDTTVREMVSPRLGEARAAYATLIETRSRLQRGLDTYERLRKLEDRRTSLLEAEGAPQEKPQVAAGLPEVMAHSLSLKMEAILRAWNFPGDCHVHYDKVASDFVIDGKPRGSRGKGLRAITHAAVSIALLEFCQEHSLPHPGFVVLDSPLLAYFKPEGDEDLALRGTDLKERFYAYLVAHHKQDSQIIIIENQHPPTSIEGKIMMTVFTGNPGEGRFGLL